MKISRIITYICFSLLAIIASASPAKRGPLELSQPDGSTFTAHIYGDEFGRIKTTIEGYAIMQDNDGWWCYASYDDQGNKYNSGWRIGEDVPASVLSASRHIPKSNISAHARARRSTFATGSLQQNTTVRNGIVILAQFKDIKFRHSKEDFIALLMSDGYNRHGATGSAKEYFEA